MTQAIGRVLVLAALSAALVGGSCGGGGGGGGGGGDDGGGCSGACPQQFLSVAEVQQIIATAVGEATLEGVAATIAVVDRVGNTLAVFQMPGAPPTTTITTLRPVMSGLEGTVVPSTIAAISKAGTAAYLSSQGNAFTTRTASQILQQNFNPGENNQPGGPLFGVQISQLPCGDFVRRFDRDALEAPKRLPLGLSADPGGLPLFEAGALVGAIGVEFDGLYTIDPDILNFDVAPEERVASAGTAATPGFSAPVDRRANRIPVNGRFLRFADDEDFAVNPSAVPAFAALPGMLVSVPEFFGFFAADGFTVVMPPAVQAGVQFLTNASGVVSSAVGGVPAEILVDTAGAQRFPPIDSTLPLPAGGGLTAAEVTTLLAQALQVAANARAQIRRPPGSQARVNISVVDLAGNVLGFARSQDAPVFGMDVSLQKARTAAFFSMTTAAADLTTAGFGAGAVPSTRNYVGAVQSFVAPAALTDGTAFSDRAGGSLSRPFFPDGQNGNPNGPLSRPFDDWSPFSTGLQVDAIIAQLVASLCRARGLGPGGTCGAVNSVTSCTDPALSEVPNGFQIFPGSVPIYRGNMLIGGIGVSGDGIEQDDLTSFLGLNNGGNALGGAINNAPPAIRSDQLTVRGNQLPFVRCPVAPFLNSDEQSPCNGK